ncbi:polysaccharide deacetylase family protein [Chryseomicrobium aureum]|uniref:polysaccharide deacetylase family protein n=1 Tax=Chryseomicrobium aureum TaxID=1441723 RepID=UPI00370D4704
MYLTFDNGYENGQTTSILDTLKEHDIKATFFSLPEFIAEAKRLGYTFKELDELRKQSVNTPISFH